MKKFIFAAAVTIWSVISSAQQAAAPNPALDGVLARMDATAANFRSAQADFTWDQYQKVVDESDKQAGKVYFRRQGKQTEMAADITSPDQKYVLFTDSTVDVYQPKIDQVTKYSAGKDREAVESFLVLGFGGRGHDLLKQFNVTYDGTETAQGVNAAKITLQPKSQRVANVFNRIILWIDPARGVSVQQQFFEPSGNYRLTKYSNIQLNQKIPDNVFKLKTTSKTTVVTPNGI